KGLAMIPRRSDALFTAGQATTTTDDSAVISGPPVVEIGSRVDRINNDICPEPGFLDFVLSVKAKVTLFFGDANAVQPTSIATNVAVPIDVTLQIAQGLAPNAIDQPTPMLASFKDIELNPGIYRIILGPSGQLAKPATFPYKLQAVTEDSTFTTTGKV